LAPERFFYNIFSKNTSLEYEACDASPDRYSFVKAKKLTLPDDFGKLGDESYDWIIHNHVLEHIPGHWFEHLQQFVRALKVRGEMIFTIPKISSNRPTHEGGENLKSDELRKKIFGQDDHFRRFGFEFIDAIKLIPNVNLYTYSPSQLDTDNLGLGTLTDPVFVVQKKL
jgi:phosphoglycolate phosphatase